MKRTTISLPVDLAAALEREAARRRVSVSQVAREAIESELGWGDETVRHIPFIGMFDSGWTPESGTMPASEYVDSDEFQKEYADSIYRDSFDRDR